MPGEWNYQPYITNYENILFYRTIGDQPNYYFTPIAVAKQIVNGTNYKFMCIATPKLQNGQPHFAIVEIYKPIKGNAVLNSITPIDLIY